MCKAPLHLPRPSAQWPGRELGAQSAACIVQGYGTSQQSCPASVFLVQPRDCLQISPGAPTTECILPPPPAVLAACVGAWSLLGPGPGGSCALHFLGGILPSKTARTAHGKTKLGPEVWSEMSVCGDPRHVKVTSCTSAPQLQEATRLKVTDRLFVWKNAGSLVTSTLSCLRFTRLAPPCGCCCLY